MSSKIPWIQTPLVRSNTLSEIAGCNIFLKLENLQPSGSFKSRGVGNYVRSKLNAIRASETDNEHRKVHFYISSGGNAGLGCVHAAVTLGCDATVVVPLVTSDAMIARLRRAGAADVVREGASWQEANDHLTQKLMPDAEARGEAAVYVPPFDAQEIWDGNKTISLEILKQIDTVEEHYPVSATSSASTDTTKAPLNVDAIVCSVGGGGLFCGIMQGIDEHKAQNTKVVAVETYGADSLFQAVEKKELVTLPAITSLAHSLGARRVCSKALEYALRDSVKTIRVTDAEAVEACRRFANDERLLVEPACGVCPALCYGGQLKELLPALNKTSNVVLVICGGSHMSLDIMEDLVKSY